MLERIFEKGQGRGVTPYNVSRHMEKYGVYKDKVYNLMDCLERLGILERRKDERDVKYYDLTSLGLCFYVYLIFTEEGEEKLPSKLNEAAVRYRGKLGRYFNLLLGFIAEEDVGERFYSNFSKALLDYFERSRLMSLSAIILMLTSVLTSKAHRSKFIEELEFEIAGGTLAPLDLIHAFLKGDEEAKNWFSKIARRKELARLVEDYVKQLASLAVLCEDEKREFLRMFKQLREAKA